MFWKKKKRISRKWIIPENQIEKFLKLYDATERFGKESHVASAWHS